MSLIPLYEAIRTQLINTVSNKPPYGVPTSALQKISYIHLWNDQLAQWMSKAKEGNQMYAVQYPCVLVEFEHAEMEQLGGGAQLYDEIIVRLHIVDKQLESPLKGQHEENKQVYALADAIYATLNLFKPTGAQNFVRLRHVLDWKHGILYHYISEFRTNYIDLSQTQPVGGVTITGGTVKPVINESYNPSPYLKPS